MNDYEKVLEKLEEVRAIVITCQYMPQELRRYKYTERKFYDTTYADEKKWYDIWDNFQNKFLLHEVDGWVHHKRGELENLYVALSNEHFAYEINLYDFLVRA